MTSGADAARLGLSTKHERITRLALDRESRQTIPLDREPGVKAGAASSDEVTSRGAAFCSSSRLQKNVLLKIDCSAHDCPRNGYVLH